MLFLGDLNTKAAKSFILNGIPSLLCSLYMPLMTLWFVYTVSYMQPVTIGVEEKGKRCLLCLQEIN